MDRGLLLPFGIIGVLIISGCTNQVYEGVLQYQEADANHCEAYYLVIDETEYYMINTSLVGDLNQFVNKTVVVRGELITRDVLRKCLFGKTINAVTVQEAGKTGCEEIYRVNSSLPSYFLYTSEDESVPDEFRVFGPMVSTDKFLDDNIFKAADGWNFYCVYDAKPAEGVEYFYHSKPCLSGAWYYRNAYVCGDVYYILNARDAGGVVLYGPFDIADSGT